jgi:hypothetical protein
MPRRLYAWSVVGGGLLVTVTWCSHAVKALGADQGLSDNALFACLAFTTAGLALGIVTNVVGAPLRARRREREVDAMTIEDMRALFVLLGLLSIGRGMETVFDASPGAWAWTSLVAGSVLGGLLIGSVIPAESSRRRISPGPTPPVQSPTRYDWR